jgi:hypothetical protein
MEHSRAFCSIQFSRIPCNFLHSDPKKRQGIELSITDWQARKVASASYANTCTSYDLRCDFNFPEILSNEGNRAGQAKKTHATATLSSRS